MLLELKYMKVFRQKQRKKLILAVTGGSLVAFVALTFFAQKQHTSQQQVVATVTPTPTPYALSQPDVDTSTWKTYTDPVLKYSIKYPENVMIDPGFNLPGTATSFIFTDENWKTLPRNSHQYESLGIYARHGFGESPRDVGEDPYEQAVKDFGYGGFQRIVINNSYGIELKGGNTYYLTENEDVKKGKAFISLGIATFQGSDSKKLEILNQMLHTFKFENN